MQIPNEQFDFLCCPKCKAGLIREKEVLVCASCETRYVIIDDIPVLIDLHAAPAHFANQIRYFEDELKASGENTQYTVREWQKSYIQKFTDAFIDIQDRIIIDCGTGSGYMAIELARKGAKIIACDLTLKSLSRLKVIAEKLHLSDNILFVCCSADNLPFNNEVADYFVSNAVLEHIPDEETAIKEINRVCKKNAGLMITVPLSYKYLNPFLMPINFMHDKRIGHLRRYHIKTLAEKFNNWSYTRTYYTGHFSKVLKVLVNLLVQVFDETKIERADKEKDKNKWGASNIIVMFDRGCRK